MPACPRGHESDDPDWCDVCGLALGAPPPPPAPIPAPGCPVCGAPMDGRFCERCGHDSAAEEAAPVPAPAPPAGWHAVVRADPAWFDVVGRQQGAGAGGLEFPRYAPERRHVLTGDRVTIGRRSATRGTAPDIDLSGFDPGVSAAHALLVARPDSGSADGGWDLVDLGSTNGTTLTVAAGPIRPHVPVPLADGTVIHLGAWTTIMITTTCTAST